MWVETLDERLTRHMDGAGVVDLASAPSSASPPASSTSLPSWYNVERGLSHTNGARCEQRASLLKYISTLESQGSPLSEREKKLVHVSKERGGLDLEKFPEVWKRDREIVLAAIVSFDNRMFEFASDNLRADCELLLAAISSSGQALKWAPAALQADRAIVWKAVCSIDGGFAFKYASEELRQDREFVLEAVKMDGCALDAASANLKTDREIVFAAVKQNGYALTYAKEHFGGDREMVLSALYTYKFAMRCASQELRNDREFVIAAISVEWFAVTDASDAMRRNRAVVLAALAKGGFVVLGRSCKEDGDHAPIKMRWWADRAVVLAAASLDAMAASIALKEADPQLLADKEIIVAALRNDVSLLTYAAVSLKGDRDVMMMAVTTSGSTLRHASAALRDDRDIVLAAVVQNKPIRRWHGGMEPSENSSLQYASEALRQDRELVLAAVTVCGLQFAFASEALRSDCELAVIAISYSWRLLKHASPILQGDRDIVLLAAKQSWSALQWCSDELFHDKDIQEVASATRHPATLTFVGTAEGGEPAKKYIGAHLKCQTNFDSQHQKVDQDNLPEAWSTSSFIGVGAGPMALHEASYHALLAALSGANKNLSNGRCLKIVGADALVIRQLRGEAICSEPELVPLYRRARQYLERFTNRSTDIRVEWSMGFDGQLVRAKALAALSTLETESRETLYGWIGMNKSAAGLMRTIHDFPGEHNSTEWTGPIQHNSDGSVHAPGIFYGSRDAGQEEQVAVRISIQVGPQEKGVSAGMRCGDYAAHMSEVENPAAKLTVTPTQGLPISMLATTCIRTAREEFVDEAALRTRFGDYEDVPLRTDVEFNEAVGEVAPELEAHETKWEALCREAFFADELDELIPGYADHEEDLLEHNSHFWMDQYR
jgi:hypothetical protein